MQGPPVSHAVPVAILVLYMVLLFAVTWWSERLGRSGGILGYLLAGREMPAGVAAAMLAGLAVGGASTIGVAERAYQVGFSAGWYNAAWAAGAFVFGLGAAARYRRQQLTTLPEFFERHYGVAARVIGVSGQLVVHLVVTALQYVAGGAILSSLLPGLFTYRQGMLVTAVIFVGITVVGGFWAAGITNVVNVAVIYVGLIVGAALALWQVGGVAALALRMPAGHPGFDLWALGPAIVAAWFVVMITQTHATQAVVQIGFACRDERSARLGYLLGGLIILPVGFIAALLGMAAAALHPGIPPAQALPQTLLGLSPLAAGVILAGLWAADVSTASALLIGSATLVSGDLIKRFLAPGLSAGRERAVCRWAVLGLSVFTFLLALTVRGILEMLLAALSISTAYALVVGMTLFRPAACRRSSATATLLATMGALVAWMLAPPAWRFLPHPIYFTWLVSVVVFFGVTLVDGRRIEAPRDGEASLQGV